MSLQMMIGRAGHAHRLMCLENIAQLCRQDPSGSPLIYLVPEQMTFQAEQALLKCEGLQGFMRAQVLSFSRLALRVMQETGGMKQYPLNRVGQQMLLRKIAIEKEQELTIFKRALDQAGFYEYLQQMMNEFKRYHLTPAQLNASLTFMGTRSPSILRDKWHDLHTLYTEYCRYAVEHYMDAEDRLNLLSEKIFSSEYLSKAEIWVDGFYQFTPQEQEVLAKLMVHCPHIHVALTLDEKDCAQTPDVWELFYPTGQTYQQLLHMATEENVQVTKPFIVSHLQVREAALSHLETYFDQHPAVPYEEDPTGSVSLSSAVNRRAEVDGVARKIREMAINGFRWREMAVLIRNPSLYQDLLETVMADHHIPLFIDQKRSMLHHPLIEFIRSALDVHVQNWPYEAVFRCIKTDLLFQWQDEQEWIEKRERFDVLENTVLAYGMRGKQWFAKDERVQGLQEEVVQPLHIFHEDLQKSSNIIEMCTALFACLERLHIKSKLEMWRGKAEREGQLYIATEHDQAWKAVLDMLDQLVEIVGDEQVNVEQFQQLIETGCTSLTFSIIPPALDQVIIGDMEHTRLHKMKAVFILGANDGIWPARPVQDGLITEEERDMLATHGVQLAPGIREQLAVEQFYAYMTFSSPTDYLWVSYALADEEGHSLIPSMMINRLKQIFPYAEEQLLVNDPYEVEQKQQLDYITQADKTLSHLAIMLRGWQKGFPVDSHWWAVYNWFVHEESRRTKARSVLSGLFYDNHAIPLSRDMARKLYGDHIRLSVSRMELFQACQFAHYLSYGLRLRERQVFRLEAPDIGQLFHDALQWIGTDLKNEDRKWSDLTKDDCDTLTIQAVQQIVPVIGRRILQSSMRFEYLQYKLRQIVARAAYVMSQHARTSAFTPLGWEVAFGQGKDLPALQLTLDNGVELEIVGRIDRVDQANSSRGLMLRVIDYKSSRTTLSLGDVYHGLSLQMLTYLDVLLTHSAQWLGSEALPAGVLYFHVHNPVILSQTYLPDDDLEQELLRRFKMQGLLLADEEAIELMHHGLGQGHSHIVPVGMKKDGQFYSYSSVASEEDFAVLRGHVQQQIRTIGQHMSEGSTSIDPYQFKKKIPCTYCRFKSICRFDQSLESNQYRLLPDMKDEDIMRKLARGGGES